MFIIAGPGAGPPYHRQRVRSGADTIKIAWVGIWIAVLYAGVSPNPSGYVEAPCRGVEISGKVRSMPRVGPRLRVCLRRACRRGLKWPTEIINQDIDADQEHP